MKLFKSLLLTLLASAAFAGTHVVQNDSSLTIGSMTLTNSNGIRFSDGSTQSTAGGGSGASTLGVNFNGVSITSPTAQINFVGSGVSVAQNSSTATVTITGGSGSGIVSPGTFTWTNTQGLIASTATLGSATDTTLGNAAWTTINSSGSSEGLIVNVNGRPSGGLQNQLGAITVKSLGPVGPSATDLVIVDSTTDSQDGGGLLEIWELQSGSGHNDPLMWIHDNGNASNPFFRADSAAPDMEIVNTSTDNAHGLGKFEPMAVAFQGTDLQTNSRCYDNSGFDNMYYWSPLSKGGGLTIQPYDASGCESTSGFSASSQTVAINWTSLNSHTVGIRGPSNPSASWTFQLPSTFSNGGQVLYQATSGSPRNWEFTTGGSAGQVLTFQGTSSAPTWTTPSSGGVSTLGVFNGQVLVTSPTAGVSFDSNTISVVLQGGATSYVTIKNSSVTLQGNTFNGNSQLVQTNGSGQLPALSGVNLTNLTAANVAAGTLGTTVIASSLAVASGNITAGTNVTVSGLWPFQTVNASGGSGGSVFSISGTTMTLLPNSYIDATSTSTWFDYGPQAVSVSSSTAGAINLDAACATSGGTCPTGAQTGNGTDLIFNKHVLLLSTGVPANNRTVRWTLGMDSSNNNLNVTQWKLKSCALSSWTGTSCSSGEQTLWRSSTGTVQTTGNLMGSAYQFMITGEGNLSGVVNVIAIPSGGGNRAPDNSVSALNSTVTGLQNASGSWVLYLTVNYTSATAGCWSSVTSSIPENVR